MIQQETNEFKAAQEREGLAAWREQQLLLLQARYGFTLPKNAIEWRAVEPTWGTHSAGPERALCCVATDGILGVFVTREEKPQVLFLHVQWFVWNSSKSSMVAYYDKELREEKRFTVSRCDGAPPPLGGRKETKEKGDRKERKPKLSLLQQALDFLAAQKPIE